jgi:ABC-2 type transport system permease protein
MTAQVDSGAIATAPRIAAIRFPSVRIFLLETRMEFLRLIRLPSFSVPILVFPLMFYVLFGIFLGSRYGGAGAGRYLLANFTVFGVMAPGLFGIGVTLAMDRDRGLLELKRALPMPPGIYLAAKLAMSMVFAAIVSILVMVLAAVLGQVVLSLTQWGTLFVLAVFGVLPFCALGLLVGTLVKGQAAPAVINLIYIPMALLSGLWMPLQMLPHVIGQLAPLWPAYHLVQLAQSVVGTAERSGVGAHLLALAGTAAVFFLAARRRLGRLR